MVAAGRDDITATQWRVGQVPSQPTATFALFWIANAHPPKR